MVIEPISVSAVSKDHIVLTGEIPSAKLAWASRVDLLTGQTIWAYMLGRDGISSAPETDASFGSSANIVAAVQMRNGGTLLCGNLPAPSRQGKVGKQRVFTTVVSSHGTAEPPQILDSIGASAGASYVELETCFAWGDRVAALGSYIGWTKAGQGSTLPERRTFYWLRVMDQSGTAILDTSYPSASPGLSPDPRHGVAVRAMRGRIIVSATDNKDTDLMSISDAGLLLSSRRMAGPYRLIRGTDDATQSVRLFEGRRGGDTRGQPVVLTLAVDLTERDRKAASLDAAYFTTFLYQTADRTTLALGGRVPSAFSPSVAAAVLFDERMRSQRILILDNRRDGVDDIGQVEAADYYAGAGEIVLARRSIGKSPASDGARVTVIRVGIARDH
jgi:hypothetical protein